MKVAPQLVALVFAAVPWPAFHPALAQSSTSQTVTPLAATAPTAVPALVPYAGVAIGSDGKALAGEAAVTFLIYKEEQGGEPLWTETQTVAIDGNGHYKVQLGATSPNGLPLDLFSTGEARWMEVQIAGQGPQPRILLASVPYALKAGDAATLGGLPASAYALAGAQTASVTAAAQSSSAIDWFGIVISPGGTANKLARFSNPATIVDSMVFDNGTDVGIGTLKPAATLDVNGNAILRGDLTLSPAGTATATAGADSRNLIFNTEAYDSATKTAAATSFQWKGEFSGNNTASPAATLNLLTSTGGAAEETGFYFLPNGAIHFAPGQSFPIKGTGGGTITGVTAGTGLTGGGTSGNVTLSLNTSQVPLLTSNNGFTGNEFVSGSVNALSTGYFAIQGVDSNASGSAVTGIATSAGGYSSGVYGSSASPNGTGVSGQATSATGNAIGASGTSVSPQGVGVQGVNNATTGGAGIVGVATAASGYSTGVYGKSVSVNGTGVSGQATSATGFAVGVNGASVSPQGAGVQGVNNSAKGGTGILGYAAATSGYTNGVYAYAVSPNGTGVNGAATSTTGYTNGVYGSSASPTGTGVHGDVTAPNGQGIYGTNEATAGPANGVLGVTASSAGSGVSGTATATSGYPVGVYGTASSALGVGVRGDSLTTTGTGPGVYGFSTSTNGTGVSGNATSTTGNTMGVLGVSASTSRFRCHGRSNQCDGQRAWPEWVHLQRRGNRRLWRE